VVHLANEREASLGKRVGDPDLPQRPVTRQGRGEDRVDEDGQILTVRATQVGSGVEAGIVDPDRIMEPQRHAGEPLPVARRPAKPPGDVLEELGKRRSGTVLRRVEHRYPAHVHRRRGTLDGKKGSIEC